MSALCFCNSSGEDDLCLCYDSEEESDEESGEETLDDSIQGDEARSGHEHDGNVDDSGNAAAEVSNTATEGSFDTGITTNGDLGDSELGNSVLGIGQLVIDNSRNGNHGNGDVENGELEIGKPTEHKIPVSPDPCSSTEYEWQFKDDYGNWISYDETNTTGMFQYSIKNKTTVSQDIDRYRKSRPIPMPLFFRKNNHRCVLDLHTMTEHDQDEGMERPIRRCPKQSHQTREGVNKRIMSTNNLQTVTEMTSQPCQVKLGSANDGIADDVAFPCHWTPMEDDAPYITVLLDPSSSEYENLVSFTMQSYPTLNVFQVKRIQNREHYLAYEKKKASMKLQFPDVDFREESLFHGTKPKHVESICKNNLNWKYFGKSHGHVLGRGAYFTNLSSKAAQYSALNQNKLPSQSALSQPSFKRVAHRVIFVVKVLIGRYIKGSSSSDKPSNDKYGLPYDTTVDDLWEPKVFVKYDSEEYYPEYVILFQ